jgi:hypothetical protein
MGCSLTVAMAACAGGAMGDIWRAATEGVADHDGWTPLMHASWEARVGVVQWLVDHGAVLDERDAAGCTALAAGVLSWPRPRGAAAGRERGRPHRG